MFLNRIAFLASIFVLLGTQGLSAQTPLDTSKQKVPLRIVSFSENNFSYGNSGKTDSLNYQLDSFQIVHPFLISTGNLGSPGKSLSFQSHVAEPFSVRPDAFSYFGFNRYYRKFYSTNQPYTLLQYFVGQRREQYVDVIHTRNFGDNLNFSFHFIRARSEGFYKRQNTSNTSVRSNLWYKSPAKRYAFMADVYWTGANVAENGGIANDSSFEFSNQIDRQIVEVNLENAGTIQRRRGVWMKHTFGFGNVTDTLTLDSAHIYNVITPSWGISLVSELSDEKYNYNDGFPQSGFYDVVYRDTLLTADSTYCWRINNSIRLEKFNQNGARSFRGYVGARHEAGEYFNDTIYHHFQNVFAEGNVSFVMKQDSVFQIRAASWYVMSGTGKGNYQFRGFIQVPLNFGKKKIEGAIIFLFVNSQKLNAQQLYTNYSGNHLRWQNSFVSTESTDAGGGLKYCGKTWLKQFSILTHYKSLTNWIFFDSTFLPQQRAGIMSVVGGTISADIDFHPFHFATRFTSNIPSSDTLRLPEYVSQSTLYVNLRLFKNALQLQVGVDVTWFSEFTAEAYMPAVVQFYLQNQRTVGNYVYIDPWVSFRIKPVRIFVKAEHVNAGMMGRKYFLLDGYPHNDFALKIGISWLFTD